MRLVECDELYAEFRRDIMGGLNWDRILREAKTVDAVPVVRCKDCKHSEHWYRDRARCFLWSEDGVSVFDDGFCNYAERKG